MKKIINGLLYNTESSEIIYVDEMTNRKIFRTEKGNFFLFYPNGEIVPKTKEDIKEYLGLNDTEKYIELFFIVLYQVFSFDVTGRSGTGPLRPDVCYSGSDTLTIPLSRSEPVLEMV